MEKNVLLDIVTYFKNMVLNSMGVERSLYKLIEDKDIPAAINLMQNRDNEVDQAIQEYNPETHKVMSRPNKYRKGDDPYITEKLPRSRQRYINEVELFFLLGNPILWNKKGGDDEAYRMFKQYLDEQRFDSVIRKAKRLAGAETESAILTHIYRDDNANDRRVKTLVLARSLGYSLRTLIDQYGDMKAFAYGYKLRENGKSVQHWDIQTPEFLFYCRKGNLGWEVETFPNPTSKINIIYFPQPKAWAGAEPRLNREEMLDSKVGDTNNYFADPIAAATADVITSMVDAEKPGKLIQLSNGNSRFEYVNPPQNSETRESEKKDLNDSILFDTFTPDFSYDNLKGLGSLSGEALENALILGYIKRDNRKEIYGELVDRYKNVVLAVLAYLHPDMSKKFLELEITFEFAKPFAKDQQKQWSSIGQLYNDGLCSLETAISMLALTDAPEDEIERITSQQKTKQENKIGFKDLQNEGSAGDGEDEDEQ